MHTDEKEMKVGKKGYHDINTIDSKTKFVIEEEFMKSRTKKRIHQYFKRIKDNIYDQLLEKYKNEKHKPTKKRRLFSFVQDGFENYKSGSKKYFSRVCKIIAGVPIACKKYGLKHNNNHIERYNQDIKDRYKTTRHWGSFQSAKKILKMSLVVQLLLFQRQRGHAFLIQTKEKIANIKQEKNAQMQKESFMKDFCVLPRNWGKSVQKPKEHNACLEKMRFSLLIPAAISQTFTMQIK